jgi:hypothetical protein
MPTTAANHLLVIYLIYTAASLALTIWLARTLFKNGEVFLEEVFADNPRLAGSVNHLLVVGFYLLNLGYAFLTLKAGHAVYTTYSADGRRRPRQLPNGTRTTPTLILIGQAEYAATPATPLPGPVLMFR